MGRFPLNSKIQICLNKFQFGFTKNSLLALNIDLLCWNLNWGLEERCGASGIPPGFTA